MWVWFEVETDRWIVWDAEAGYRKLGNRDFETAYELDAVNSGFDLPGRELE